MSNHVVFLLVLLSVITPLVFLVAGSFSRASLPTDFSVNDLGIGNYITVYTDPGTYAVLTNTVIYATGSVAFGIILATLLAWLVERTNLPWKLLIYAGVPMAIAMPGMLQAMAWVLLFSPRIGFINKLLKGAFSLTESPINIYSLPGMISIEGLRLVPTAFLMLVPLMRSMDPSLEEAAQVSGASPGSTTRKITLRLLAPGLVAVTIYQAMSALEGFEIPGILGMPAGIHVFATKIYSLVHSATFPPPYGEANALSMAYIGLAVVAMYFYSRLISRTEKYTIITGRGYRPRLIDLGAWRYAALAFGLVYLFFSIVLPFAVLLYSSFLPYLQTPSLDALRTMTLKNYRMLAQSDDLGSTLRNTVVMVAVTATAATIFSFFVSLIVVRTRFWGRKVLDQLAFLPHLMPGMVMALAFLWIFLNLDPVVPIYGTIWTISIAFTVSFLAYGTRSMNAAILQIHKELEEAAYTSGASPRRTAIRIFFPLMLPTFAGVWIWVVLHAVRFAGTPLMLSEGSKNRVLAILIWNMWDWGHMGAVAAIGTLLIIVLLTLTVVVRLVGFRRQAVPLGG
jgi:iron(III) transport system permease protein